MGPGLGALTEVLVEQIKKIYAIEIESKFCSYLSKKFFERDNLEIMNADILRVEIPHCNKVISSIPYSITGPLLEKLFFKANPPQGILIIEKNIAERIFFKNRYKKFSRITITLNSFMKPVKKFNISRNSFYPTPNIDLSLIKMISKTDINFFLFDNVRKSFFLKFVAGIMPYKNKNMLNALNLYFKSNNNINLKKEEILDILKIHNYFSNKINNKVFKFKIKDFVELSKIFFSYKNHRIKGE